MSGSFVPLGSATTKVVVDLAERRPSARAQLRAQLIRDLKGSVTLLDAQKPDKDAARARARAFNCDAAKATITKAIGDLRDNSSPQEAIDFLADTLAAIGGMGEVR